MFPKRQAFPLELLIRMVWGVHVRSLIRCGPHTCLTNGLFAKNFPPLTLFFRSLPEKLVSLLTRARGPKFSFFRQLDRECRTKATGYGRSREKEDRSFNKHARAKHVEGWSPTIHQSTFRPRVGAQYKWTVNKGTKNETMNSFTVEQRRMAKIRRYKDQILYTCGNFLRRPPARRTMGGN